MLFVPLHPDIHVMMVEMNQFNGALIPNVTTSSNGSRGDTEDTIYYPESLFSAAIKDKAKDGMAVIYLFAGKMAEAVFFFCL